MLDTPTTPSPARAAFDADRCLRCLAGSDPAKRTCAAARLLAAGFDLETLVPTNVVRQ